MTDSDGDAGVCVLVPDEEGAAALTAYPLLRPQLLGPGGEPTAGQRDHAVVLVHGFHPVERTLALLPRLPHVRLVQTLNAGYDGWIGRLPPGVGLSNARGAHGAVVAEWVVAVLLAHHRELTFFAEAQRRRRWERRTGRSLAGSRVAVLGAGDIGRHVAGLLRPFGCEVTLVGRRARAGVLSTAGFAAVAAEQDVVVLALPAGPDTDRIADARFLAGLRDGAVLVNAGRGTLVDTDALLRETGGGRLHAILDVTDPEPLPPDHPLWDAPNVTLTPHVAGVTEGIAARAWAVAAAQIDLFAHGRRPDNLVIDPT
ncbi:NAD(P)-dependent oxidoreductase [Micromonospora haikouensis]|uniref:D-isomer specific 2-hydroxyacid dehydrogenase NAD-binding domain-containing protein n=1 Tax=Micromonospora haikouensis TaxID=686309 RepID=A0A0D0WVJ6_9ACTN|nr:NAD(P)-dependent oxidoreductase [Micromonospora haikouensis]KIR61425.1 hypothetical protein TK50_27745 [Micromonospora haikouensis]